MTHAGDLSHIPYGVILAVNNYSPEAQKMLKSELARMLQALIESDGDSVLGLRELVEIAFPGSLHEYDARENMVRNIVKAKRDLGEPMSSDFFKDVWPKAVKALKASIND